MRFSALIYQIDLKVPCNRFLRLDYTFLETIERRGKKKKSTQRGNNTHKPFKVAIKKTRNTMIVKRVLHILNMFFLSVSIEKERIEAGSFLCAKILNQHSQNHKYKWYNINCLINNVLFERILPTWSYGTAVYLFVSNDGLRWCVFFYRPTSERAHGRFDSVFLSLLRSIHAINLSKSCSKIYGRQSHSITMSIFSSYLVFLSLPLSPPFSLSLASFFRLPCSLLIFLGINDRLF